SQKKGYICMESEGAKIYFRNIRIVELPPGVTAAEQSAPEGEQEASAVGDPLIQWELSRQLSRIAGHQDSGPATGGPVDYTLVREWSTDCTSLRWRLPVKVNCLIDSSWQTASCQVEPFSE